VHICIARAQMRDLVGYQKYGKLVAKLRRIIRPGIGACGKYQVVEGPDDFDRMVTSIRVNGAALPTTTREYQAAAAIRRAASGRCEVVITKAD